MEDNKTVGDVVHDAATGEDRPMEKTNPRTTFSLIFGTYPLILIIALIIFIIWAVARY